MLRGGGGVFMKADRIDWERAPSWAAEWDKNPDVCRPGDEPGRLE